MTMKEKKKEMLQMSHVSRCNAFSSSFALISNSQSNWKNISVLLNRDPHYEANLVPKGGYTAIFLDRSSFQSHKEAEATRPSVRWGSCDIRSKWGEMWIQCACRSDPECIFYSFHEAINAVQTTLSEESCGRVHSHEGSSSSGGPLAARPEFISWVKAKFYIIFVCN